MPSHYGTEGNDLLYGNPGANNTIFGFGGDDVLRGENLADYISGGFGNDFLTGLSGDDNLYGDDGYDVIDGGGGADFASGGAGDDTIVGGQGNDTLFGDDGDDQIGGDDGADFLVGGAGDDLLNGGAGNDTLDGGAGENRLAGLQGNDYYVHNWITGGNTLVYEDYGTDTISFTNATLAELRCIRTDNNNDLVIYHVQDAADGIIQHGVIIDDYMAYWSADVEYLNVGNQTIGLWDWVVSELF